MTDGRTFDRFIERWRHNEGGAERANFPLFLTELCALLGLPQPDPADATHERNDYVFERDVPMTDEDGRISHKRIDLYRRGCFVLEAKQSRIRGGAKEVPLGPGQTALPGLAAEEARGRRSAHRGWDVLMRNAREQAEQYARALPVSHGWPPFILVCDVGHVIELFADFSGQGKNYRQFPDREGFRVYLEDLKRPDIQAVLRAIWEDPLSLDPARRSAAVTRDIAGRLARVSERLEKAGQPPERVAHFLMRCLFTMFAEDVGLIDHGIFADLLNDARANPASFVPMMQDLWKAMDEGGFAPVLRQNVRRFNGGLFKDRTAIALDREEIGELHEAARHDWRDVEPAIFGTLLEQALDKTERKRLGAHYTPRPYVERLVTATVIDPLRDEWESVVLPTVERERAADPELAIRAARDFHAKLAGTRVLDPACGTGNFLYVALELMKRLEGDVLEVLLDIGGQEALAMETLSVHPRNFLGLELNPRAAAIAELVLWLGYLQWQLRNGGSIHDPVLEKLDNIRAMDAVLAHDPERPATDRQGTGLPNPRRPEWPEADYIVGNPPFIGGKDIRGRLGDAYATALWKAHPKINKSADFVMYWWDRAADILTRKGTRLKRFGFVTTNSITQEFSRRVIQARMDGRPPVSLAMAIPDHPWTKATRDTAAVRIAMTVARCESQPGQLLRTVHEAGLETDAPRIVFGADTGAINPDLTIGHDIRATQRLIANGKLSMRGVEFHGDGYVISAAEKALLMGSVAPGIYCRPYASSNDIKRSIRERYVIDLHDLTQNDVRRRFPDLYQHLLTTAKPSRAGNRLLRRREEWWKLALPHTELRDGIQGLTRFIVTIVTAKHRAFSFVDGAYLPDQSLMTIASDSAALLGILSSRPHLLWTGAAGGTLEDRPRYNNTVCFDPFPFPGFSAPVWDKIGELAEDLDATRKEVLTGHADLTLTALYNLREKLMRGEDFTVGERDQRMRGRVDIIAELHDRIDAAVAEAYGWPVGLSDREIVARLVALNAERAEEERRGIVRWLRPDYQQKRAGLTVLEPRAAGRQIEANLAPAKAAKPLFPRDAIGQTAAVLADLRGGGVLDAGDITRRYAQGRKVERRVTATLEALARLGHVSTEPGGYRLRKAA